MKKRLILCMDGTSNNTNISRKDADNGAAVTKPTNILKLARCIDLRGHEDGFVQIVHYMPGVAGMGGYPGLSNKILALTDKATGSIWGAGFEHKVAQALTWLVNNYQTGDEVFIFGFSRGAAEARALCQAIDWIGGLPEQGSAYFLPQIFKAYIDNRGESSLAEVGKTFPPLRNAEKTPFLERVKINKEFKVTYLGVWDTVMSLGSRLANRGWFKRRVRTTGTKYSFHVDTAPALCVDHAYHAIAADEERHDFFAEIWTQKARPDQQMQQRFFPGHHRNIGGSAAEDGVANCALWYIVEAAQTQGLRVIGRKLTTRSQKAKKGLDYYRPFVRDRITNSNTLFWQAITVPRALKRSAPRAIVGLPETANIDLHACIIERVCAPEDTLEGNAPGDKGGRQGLYRPRNVADFLRNKEKAGTLDAYLKDLNPKKPNLHSLPQGYL